MLSNKCSLFVYLFLLGVILFRTAFVSCQCTNTYTTSSITVASTSASSSAQVASSSSCSSGYYFSTFKINSMSITSSNASIIYLYSSAGRTTCSGTSCVKAATCLSTSTSSPDCSGSYSCTVSSTSSSTSFALALVQSFGSSSASCDTNAVVTLVTKCCPAPTGQPSRQPTGQPSRQPTCQPTSYPSHLPSLRPTKKPTILPTVSTFNMPSIVPTHVPTIEPTMFPTGSPSEIPSCTPTEALSLAPTFYPTDLPSVAPSNSPTEIPTAVPSDIPTEFPSIAPSEVPSQYPSFNPTDTPTDVPSFVPTALPTEEPSDVPTVSPTRVPSDAPSLSPSILPTDSPTFVPSAAPTATPTQAPSDVPTATPTPFPSQAPSNLPTKVPTRAPSEAPTISPSFLPTEYPTLIPSSCPTAVPTDVPSNVPTIVPSRAPSEAPSLFPSLYPTDFPSFIPSCLPSNAPTTAPSVAPSAVPSEEPSIAPTFSPSVCPTSAPTVAPSSTPTKLPTLIPTVLPSQMPTYLPTQEPTVQPTIVPTSSPTDVPTIQPTTTPSAIPTIVPAVPTASPTMMLTASPSPLPSTEPSQCPTNHPTIAPTEAPTHYPSCSPSTVPTAFPAESPTTYPSILPSASPTTLPTQLPSHSPSAIPSLMPTSLPSLFPTETPSHIPSLAPTSLPSLLPSNIPSLPPSITPSMVPSRAPSAPPTNVPSDLPTVIPSPFPSACPSISPSDFPSQIPTHQPSVYPTQIPSLSMQSLAPTDVPTYQLTGSPSPTFVPSHLMATTSSPSNMQVFITWAPSCIPSSSPSIALSPTSTPSEISGNNTYSINIDSQKLEIKTTLSWIFGFIWGGLLVVGIMIVFLTWYWNSVSQLVKHKVYAGSPENHYSSSDQPEDVTNGNEPIIENDDDELHDSSHSKLIVTAESIVLKYLKEMKDRSPLLGYFCSNGDSHHSTMSNNMVLSYNSKKGSLATAFFLAFGKSHFWLSMWFMNGNNHLLLSRLLLLLERTTVLSSMIFLVIVIFLLLNEFSQGSSDFVLTSPSCFLIYVIAFVPLLCNIVVKPLIGAINISIDSLLCGTIITSKSSKLSTRGQFDNLSIVPLSTTDEQENIHVHHNGEYGQHASSIEATLGSPNNYSIDANNRSSNVNLDLEQGVSSNADKLNETPSVKYSSSKKSNVVPVGSAKQVNYEQPEDVNSPIKDHIPTNKSKSFVAENTLISQFQFELRAHRRHLRAQASFHARDHTSQEVHDLDTFEEKWENILMLSSTSQTQSTKEITKLQKMLEVYLRVVDDEAIAMKEGLHTQEDKNKSTLPTELRLLHCFICDLIRFNSKSIDRGEVEDVQIYSQIFIKDRDSNMCDLSASAATVRVIFMVVLSGLFVVGSFVLASNIVTTNQSNISANNLALAFIVTWLIDVMVVESIRCIVTDILPPLMIWREIQPILSAIQEFLLLLLIHHPENDNGIVNDISKRFNAVSYFFASKKLVESVEFSNRLGNGFKEDNAMEPIDAIVYLIEQFEEDSPPLMLQENIQYELPPSSKAGLFTCFLDPMIRIFKRVSRMSVSMQYFMITTVVSVCIGIIMLASVWTSANVNHMYMFGVLAIVCFIVLSSGVLFGVFVFKLMSDRVV